MAEALNDTLMNYLVNFSVAHPTAPAEQADWARRLRELADQCLDMIAPGFSPDLPPQRVAPAVGSALFHNGTPEGIARAHLRWLGFDSEWDAVDKASSSLWLLRTFALNSEQRWIELKVEAGDKNRKKVRPALLSWVADLGKLYAHVFGRLPSYSTSDGDKLSPFVRFGEVVRMRVLDVQEGVTEGGTDAAAYNDLQFFDAQKFARFAKSHAAKIRPRWEAGLTDDVTPDSFRLGIASENGPDKPSSD